MKKNGTEKQNGINGIDTVKSYQFPSLRIKETLSNYVSFTDTF